MSASLRASWLADEEIEGPADVGLEFLARNDGVEEAVLEQKFGGLKTFGEFLTDGLLDDARTGERKGNLASSRRASAAATLASCIRLTVPSIMRAPPEQETTIKGSLFSMQRSMARATFSPTTAPMEPPMKRNSMEQQITARPLRWPSAVMIASFRPSLR